MPFVIAAIVVLAVLAVFQLVLMFAVLRRLRSHEELLASATPSRLGPEALIGRALPEFEAVSTTGTPVSRATLAGRPRLIGVFSPTCQPCHEQALEFARHDDPDRVAVLTANTGTEQDQRTLIGELGAAPTIIAGPAGTRLSRDIGVDTFPTLLLVDGTGTIVQAGHALTKLTAPARV